MNKKAILFDLDNTLYEYEPIHQEALKKTYDVLKKEIKISFNEFLKLFKLSKSEIQRELAGTASSHNRVLYFQRLIEKTHNTIDPDIVLKLYDSYWNTFLKSIKLRDGVLHTLRKLKEMKIKTAIVSDLTTNIQLKKMSKLGIKDYIDVLVTSEEAGNEKPNPVMFLLALNKLNVLPSDAIMVGDNPINDIEGGNAVGLDTVLLYTERSLKHSFSEDYQKPNHRINDIKDLLKILES